ncbi:MAG TPA: GNAT family N-acetyltransferase [Myxococcota bacterium]|nr:GNAT family N-acetyltransferase [Myxococcota bacterium]
MADPDPEPPASPPPPGPASPPPADGGFSEREFYRREFRGRTLAITLPRAYEPEAAKLVPVVNELLEGGARVVVIAHRATPAAELLGAEALAESTPRLEAEVWRRLQADGRVVVALGAFARFPEGCRDVAERLGVFKLVWLDRAGGLVDRSGQRHSFVHLGELTEFLAASDARPDDPRTRFWREVETTLRAGVPAVNVCSLDALDDELFSYAGSGTLFTRERYVQVRHLGIDDFDAAHDLVRRGAAEGYLAPRSAEDVDEILAGGFGAFVEDRHLAGIAALLDHGEAAELASLYTVTRFVGEGVGGHLVAFSLALAREQGRAYVFACTTSDRVGAFFLRQGFAAVSQDEVPASKWASYDAERRERVRCFRYELG